MAAAYKDESERSRGRRRGLLRPSIAAGRWTTGRWVNAPPTYAWYVAGFMLEWLKEQGGLVAIEARDIRKARKPYSAIDASPFYSNLVETAVRSRMNTPFGLPYTPEHQFLAEGKEAGPVYRLHPDRPERRGASRNAAITSIHQRRAVPFRHWRVGAFRTRPRAWPFSGISRLFLPAQKVKLILWRNFSDLWRSPGSFSDLG